MYRMMFNGRVVIRPAEGVTLSGAWKTRCEPLADGTLERPLHKGAEGAMERVSAATISQAKGQRRTAGLK